MAALLARLADLTGRHRWLTLLVWLALVVVAAPSAGGVADRLSSGGFEVPGSQSVHVNDLLDEAGRGAQPFIFVVDAPDAERAQARLDEVRAEAARAFPMLSFPESPLASPDGTALALTGFAPVTQDGALDLAGEIRPVLEQPEGEVRTFLLGPGATYRTFQDVTTADITAAESIGLPVVAIVLIALFGALVAAVLPMALGLVAVAITFGIVAFVAGRTEVSIYAQTMTSMIGLGVAVDYSLFILARFREELAQGVPRADAVRHAMRTSGTAVAFSGLTVIVALGTVWIVPVRAVQSMAAAAMMVTAVAVVAAATLLPALLHLLGHRVDRLRIPFPRRDERGREGFWHAHTRRVMARPVAWLAAGTAFLLVLALPLFSLKTLNTSTAQLPSDEPVVVGTRLLEEKITGPGQGAGGRLVVAVEPREGADPGAVEAATAALAERVEAVPGVGDAVIEPLGTALLVQAPLQVAPESSEAVERIVPAVREAAAADEDLARLAEVNTSGVSAFQADLNAEIVGKLWLVVIALLALAYLILLVLLRSVLLPLKAVLLNLLSIGAAYGVLIAVFQWGWLDWLGYDSLGVITPITLPLIMTITFGLSMDYEVFLLSRIKERYDAYGDNTLAVSEGLAGSARVITSAAAIMVAVFGAFVLTGVPAIKEIGLGLAVAILVDATITRLILVPASMRLLGRWNWWLPGWLDRRLPHLAHERAAAPVG